MKMNVFDTKDVFVTFLVLQSFAREQKCSSIPLCGHSTLVKMFRLSFFSQLYRHPKVGTCPFDIRTARSKAAFVGRQPFNAVPAPSTAHVGILV